MLQPTAVVLNLIILRRWGLDRSAENPVASVVGCVIGGLNETPIS